MKKSELRQIIKEEITSALKEEYDPNQDPEKKGSEAYKRSEWKGRYGSMDGFDKAYPQYSKGGNEETVESSVKQGLNQMFSRLADIVDDKDDIQSETLGVTNYIKRLMREYAKYADMDRQDSIEGGNKFSKQGKEEARQEIERILSREY